jgi:hypothetical protein
VVTTGAAEPDGTGTAAGLHVGRLGAAAVGDGDLLDRVSGVLGVHQRLGVAPEPVAVPVEAERGHRVDGGAAPWFPHPVVPLSDVEVAVVEQFGEHVERDTGVRVPLGVGVAVGVEHRPGRVELAAVAGAQCGQAGDPFPVSDLQVGDGQRAPPVGVAPMGGQQFQLADRGVGEAVAHPPLLSGDHLGGLDVDR